MKKLLAISVLTALSGISVVSAQPAQQRGAQVQTHQQQRFAKLDVDGNGKVTREELQKSASARFDRVDTDHDGSVSEAEHTAARQARAEKRLSRRDADGNGALDASELKGRKAKMLERLDADGDGKLSQTELERARGRRQAREGKQRKADEKPNTKAELSARVNARFDELDQNQDGVLTADELAKGHRGGRGHGRQDGKAKTDRG